MATFLLGTATNHSTLYNPHFADAADFPKILAEHGIDWNSIRDPWGHPYDVVLGAEISYNDKVAVHTYGQTQTTSQTPVTHKIKTLRIISNGPDGKPNTPDDFEVARFSSPLSDETPSGTSILSTRPFFSGNTGAIRVRVLDESGAVIPNANVAAINDVTSLEATATSDNEDVCLLRNLPPGYYHVVVSVQGFQRYAMQSVPVYSSSVTELELTLQVGAAMQTVTVSAEAVSVQTSASSMAINGRSIFSLVQLSLGVVDLKSKSGAASGRIAMPLATPRLRKDFPETLFWQPEILTDRSGHTTVKFPLADSITTWKVSAIASTLDGHIATATKEIRAFQPFFAELDPPKVLTVGDEIHLPVIVRNYLEKPQSISLDWAHEPWADSLSPRTATTEVAAGDYAQKIFSFRAKLPMKDAKQRLSAYNRSNEKESDAVERQLRIHADGQERVVQASSVFSHGTSRSLNIPPSALPGSIEAELVVYPNLVSHVAEAIEAIFHRSYGCAEQTISSAYPSLLWLQLKKSQHLPASEPAHPIQILVDGKPATELPLPADARQITPLHGDLSAFLSPGEHRVELRGVPSSRASAYLTSVYYLPWTDPLVAGSTARSGDSESLRYAIKFDRTSSAVGDSILCTVHAERVGFHGYGMMLAEIGLPPGADVDRASLDALSTSTWDVQSYEIQPDRAVFYLWPRAGGTTFSFSLKPRFAMSAQSAESLLYDYYNPEARASVPPPPSPSTDPSSRSHY